MANEEIPWRRRANVISSAMTRPDWIPWERSAWSYLWLHRTPIWCFQYLKQSRLVTETFKSIDVHLWQLWSESSNSCRDLDFRWEISWECNPWQRRDLVSGLQSRESNRPGATSWFSLRVNPSCSWREWLMSWQTMDNWRSCGTKPTTHSYDSEMEIGSKSKRTRQFDWNLTSLFSKSIMSYSLRTAKKIIEVTFSKQWIHFRLSDRCPPTSTIL